MIYNEPNARDERTMTYRARLKDFNAPVLLIGGRLSLAGWNIYLRTVHHYFSYTLVGYLLYVNGTTLELSS